MKNLITPNLSSLVIYTSTSSWIKKFFLLTVLMSTAAFSTHSFANPSATGYTNYVTDTLRTPLRTNPTHRHKIIRMLPPGSKVTILKANNDGWSNVIFNHRGRDIKGWLPSASLQNMPIAQDRLTKQTEKVGTLTKENTQLKVDFSTLTTRYEETSEELREIKSESFQIESELSQLKAISGQSIQIGQENEQHIKRIKILTDENIIMKERISQAEDVVQRQWFLTGAGVLLLGVLLGRFFRKPTKKNKWNSL